jgi:hypothetical protein
MPEGEGVSDERNIATRKPRSELFKSLLSRMAARISGRGDVLGEVITRLVIWLLLGSAINVLPLIVAYISGAGDEVSTNTGPLTAVLSSGDLLIATTAMLPPALADLALNATKAPRTRTIIIVFGAFVSLVALLLYGFAYANDKGRQHGQPPFAHLSPLFVAQASMGFFGCAVILGGATAAFLAIDSTDGANNATEEESAA